MPRVLPLLLATLLNAVAANQSGPVPPPPASSIRGSAVSPDGATVRDVAVLLFPASEDAWAPPAAIQCQPLTDGAFTFATAPPGEYLLAVASLAVLSDCRDPDRLRHSRQGAPSIRVAPTGAEMVLRIVIASDPAPRIVSMTMTTTAREPIGSEPGAALPPGAPRPPAMPSGRRGLPVVERPGAISGRLTGPDGRPIPGVAVQAARRQSTNPNVMLLPYSQSVTRADGTYYIPNAPDGELLVVALPVRQGTSPIDPPVPAVLSAVGADGRRTGPLLTYFPGVASAAAARPVRVSGGEVTGVDFVMRRGAVSTVSIAVKGLDPKSGPGTRVTLLPQPFVDQIGGRNVRRELVVPDGRLMIADVPAGTHVLMLDGPTGWARRTVNVGADGRAIEVEVALQPHFLVSGSVELQAERVGVDGAVLGQIRVELQPVPRTSGSPLLRVSVSETGTFTIPRVPGGRYTLTVAAPTYWIPISGTIDGRDTLDFPIDLTAGVTDAVLVLADRETMVHGRVRGPDGSAATGARVVLFADDSQYWTSENPRRVQVLIAGPGGAYSLAGLPPGSYRAAAFPPGTAIPRGRLAEVRARAESFTLSIGGSAVVDLLLEPR